MTGKKSKTSRPQEFFTKENPLCAGDLKLFVGAKIEALDSRRWYQAKVVSINQSTYKVLVHFEGWNSRHDKWFDHRSESLRSLSSHEASHYDSSKGKELQPGDRVLARWSDSKFYPAKIHSLINEKTFEVIFFDGFKKRLNKSSIRPDPKRTFESFEEKFKLPVAEGQPCGSSTPVPDLDNNEPVASTSKCRTKRRHTEPTTMADFVTSIPGKRPKHHFGTPSDSEEFFLSYESWQQNSREDSESLGSSTPGVKRGSALCKEKRLGYPVDSDLQLPSPKMKKSASDLSWTKRSPRDQLSSSTESLSSFKDQDTSGEKDDDDSTPLAKMVKKTFLSNVLQIKLPMKSRGRKKRGRKKRFFRLHQDNPQPESVLTGAESGNVNVNIAKDSDRAEVSSEQCSTRTENQEMNQMTWKKDETECMAIGSVELKICGDAGSLESNSSAIDNLQKSSDAPSEVNTAITPTSTIGLRVPKKRGRKPGKPNSVKKSIGEPKILPKRERKLTEKGLELLQIIGHKKGADCLLKEAFVSLDAPDDHSVKGRTDDNNRPCEDVSSEKRELEKSYDSIDRPVLEEKLLENRCKDDLIIEEKTAMNFSDRQLEIPQAESAIDVDKLAGVTEIKGQEQSKEVVMDTDKSLLETEELNPSKDDDKYSDTYSEGSGSLVIDIEDDMKEVGSDSGHIIIENRSGAEQKGKQMALPNVVNDKSIETKPRTFPRLKYTLSHEERRGNRLAKLKQNRMKNKLKRDKKKDISKLVNEGEKTVESLKSLALDKNQIPLSSQSSMGVSPLESLTKMVSETSKPLGLCGEGKVSLLPDATRPSVASEEAVKPIKSTKQQRAPYKPRMKISDNFLSMVEQDRPSQIERPLSNDLIKEKSSRGRPRNRPLSRLDDQEGTGLIRDDQKRNDLNEPLEFSATKTSVKTIDLCKTELPGLVYPRPNMQAFGGQQSLYVPPQTMGPLAPNTVIGPVSMHLPPQKMESFRDGSPHASISTMPVIKSEPPGYENLTPNTPQIVPYQPIVCSKPEIRASLPDYNSRLQPMVNQRQMHSNAPVQMPVDFAPGCVRMQRPSVAFQGSWDQHNRSGTGRCPCQECFDVANRSKEVVSVEQGGTQQGACGSSYREVSLGKGDGNSLQKNDSGLMSSASNSEQHRSDQELIITGVFSLRNSTGMPSHHSGNGKAQVPFGIKVEIDAGSKSHIPTDAKDVAEREDQKEAIEVAQAAAKPKEFETKKKRLDLITGKLSAQKRMSPIDDMLNKIERNEGEGCSLTPPRDANATSRGQEETAKSLSPYSSQTTSVGEQQTKLPHIESVYQQANLSQSSMVADQQAMTPHIEYVYPQTTFMPMMNPHFDFQPAGPSSTIDAPPPRAISPEMHMVPRHPGRIDPRGYFPSPEYFQPIRPVYDPEAMQHPGYQHPVHRIPFMPPEMVNHPRFQQMPTFPYVSPRFVPAPRYFVQRDSIPMATSRPPPPYGSLPMTSSSQRFRAVPPNGRIPLVVCKQSNCNCHLPHAAPPIQVIPPHIQTTQPPEKTAEDETANSKAQQAATLNEPMMKGDPRRLTLPLQRLKKVGMKSQNDSLKPRDGFEQSLYDGNMKEGAGSEEAGENETEKEEREFDCENGESHSKMHSYSQDSENDKSCKFEVETKNGVGKKFEKGQRKEHVLAPKEFVVELDLNEFQCKFKGCKKTFRKASNLDNHQRYFHSPRVPQRKKKPSCSMPSPVSGDALLSPAFAKFDARASSEDLTSIRSGYSSSVVTDDNISDREKHYETSSDESEDSEFDSNGSVCVDDIIRCKCGDLEEQGFMIQCEQCLTWQHGDCVNLTIQTMPKSYFCYVCTNPQGLKNSHKYKNNYEWFKKGTLPSLIKLEDKNQKPIAELMQASHALMEDIANVFDVIAGMKKKISLLNAPCHPALKLWAPAEESKAEGPRNDKTYEKQDNEKALLVTLDDTEIEDQKRDSLMETENNMNGQNDCVNQTEKRLSNGHSAELGTNENAYSQADEAAIEKDRKTTDPANKLATIESEKDKGRPLDEKTFSETSVDGEMRKTPCNETDVSTEKSKSETEKSETVNEKKIEDGPQDILSMKIKLQDDLESIEEELNLRMDEIESNLDVLEQKYSECEMKTNEGESAFKVALPDMTSVARHLNMINRQLIDLC